MKEFRLDVIGFGALNFDILYRVEEFVQPGDEDVILESDQAPGGSAANTIIGLARLGLKTGFIGILSLDDYGKLILKDFEDHNVNTEGISFTSSGSTGKVIGFVNKKGERILHVEPGVNNELKLSRINVEYAKRGKWIHLSSFVSDQQLREQINLIKILLKENGKVRYSLSPGMIYARKGFKKLEPLLRYCEILFLNQKEIETLVNLPYKEASKFLLKRGVKVVVVTRDAQGCYVATPNKQIIEGAIKQDKVVDTTGAGDAFAAGFLYGYLKKKSLRQCAKYGNYVAGHCVTKLGARKGLVYSLNSFGVKYIKSK